MQASGLRVSDGKMMMMRILRERNKTQAWRATVINKFRRIASKKRQFP